MVNRVIDIPEWSKRHLKSLGLDEAVYTQQMQSDNIFDRLESQRAPSSRELAFKDYLTDAQKRDIEKTVAESVQSKSLEEGSLKYDTGKPALTEIFNWLDIDWLMGVCSVLRFGAVKYSKNNWQKGFEPNRVLDGALRHIYAHVNGEFFDSESKLPHLLHSACGLMFAYFHSKKKGLYENK